MVATGPLVGGLLGALLERPGGDTPELWALSELPLQPDAVPVDLRRALERTGRLCVVEEHVASGGVGQMLAHFALSQGIQLEAFEHAAARGYPSGRYGSQAFHRKESGLDAASLLGRIDKLRARR